MSYGKPLPRIDTLNQPFWAAAKQGRLLLQRCPACGDTRFPPGPLCPKCPAGDQVWIEASGKGTLESWIDMHGASAAGSRMTCPTGSAWFGSTKGRCWPATSWKNGRLAGGAPVRVVFDKVTDDVKLPKFTLA